MRAILAIFSALALVVLTGTPMPAAAHSIKDEGELDRLMGDREQYFQPLDKEAPDFTLQDADGNVMSRTGLRGKVTVLHFIYAGCPDVCPLHAEKLADVQNKINLSPMSVRCMPTASPRSRRW